jgi:hypothetical protein
LFVIPFKSLDQYSVSSEQASRVYVAGDAGMATGKFRGALKTPKVL